MEEDSPQNAMFRSSMRTSHRPYWRIVFPIVTVIAIATYAILLSASSHEHQEGALNGLGPVVAGLYAVAAFIGSLVVALVVRYLLGVERPDADASTTKLQTAGLVLGIIALTGIPLVQVAAVAICVLGLLRATTPEQTKVRWRPVVGLACTCLGVAINLAIGMAPLTR